MTHTAWTTLLDEARKLHDEVAPVRDFCAFPDTLSVADVEAHYDPLCDTMRADPALNDATFESFRQACFAAAPCARWRETYKDTVIGEELHASFGCYEVIGVETPLRANNMRSFLVYQRPGYHYPLHHHPAEELYLVLAGAGEFVIEGKTPRWLTPGDTAFHRTNVPHALTTKDQPILAYVLWRGDLTTKPVFTYPEQLA